MNSTTRLIVNTLAQNIRTVLNVVLSLYATRIVMDALGQSDYGIYMLVAGIVSLLSHLSGALTITTQRHLSFSFGRNDKADSKSLFANSYLLNWGIAILIVGIALAFTNVIFDHGWLNIQQEKIVEAKYVYFCVLASIFLTFPTASFKALFIAHENIVFISFVDVLDGVLKLALVFLLYKIQNYRLTMYALIITFINFVKFTMLACYSIRHYEECILLPRVRSFRKEQMMKIIGFTTWTLYGTTCIFIRMQGLAVTLNRAFGSVINASFGLSNQILNSVSSVSDAIVSAAKPQITKAEGVGNRQKMLSLSLKTCKYSYLLLSLITIPLVVEMPSVFRVWLGEVPPNAVIFCRFMLVSALFDQITTGLSIANAAIGKIRNFTLAVYTTKILVLPAAVFFIRNGFGLKYLMLSYFLFEALSGLVRIPFLMRTAGLKLSDFFGQVIMRIIAPTVGMAITSYLFHKLFHFSWSFLVTGAISCAVGALIIFCTSISRDERKYLKRTIQNRFGK